MNPKLDGFKLAMEQKPGDEHTAAHAGLLSRMAHAAGGKLGEWHQAYKQGYQAAGSDFYDFKKKGGDTHTHVPPPRSAPEGHPHPHLWNAGYGMGMSALLDS